MIPGLAGTWVGLNGDSGVHYNDSLTVLEAYISDIHQFLTISTEPLLISK